MNESASDVILRAFVEQQKIINTSLMTEVRKNRRSALIRAALWTTTLLVMSVISLYPSLKGPGSMTIPSDGPYASVVRITGAIQDGAAASLKELEASLYQAFHDEKSNGVLLMINSPGGAPVESNNINQYILHLKKETGKKVIVLGGETLASGAYMIASASDKIFVNASTIAGSIGVFNQSFGLNKLLNAFGVEARTFHAGEHKRRLDPFSEVTPDDVQHMNTMLGGIHKEFIATVKAGRGDRLKGDPNVLFSGDSWTGRECLEMGLVDGLSTYHDVLLSEFGAKRAVDFTQEPSFFAKVSGSMKSSISEAFHNLLIAP